MVFAYETRCYYDLVNQTPVIESKKNTLLRHGSCVILSPVVFGVSRFFVSIRFFHRFFFQSLLKVFVGNYDFSRQGVPIASCVANFSGFGSDCPELKKFSWIGGFSQICGKSGGSRLEVGLRAE